MIKIDYPVQNAQCITIQSSNQIYVYPNSRQRDTYVLIGDTWKKIGESTTTTGYNNMGFCQPIADGFPYSNPEVEVYFPILSVLCFIGIIWLAYRLIIKKLWRRI